MLGYPEVVIFDEPTAGIDPVAKFHVWEAVAAVRNSGTSVIIASQDMDECEALCSRIGIMSEGQLRCIGTPQYLKSRLNSGYKLVVQLSCSTTTGELDNNVVRLTIIFTPIVGPVKQNWVFKRFFSYLVAARWMGRAFLMEKSEGGVWQVHEVPPPRFPPSTFH